MPPPTGPAVPGPPPPKAPRRRSWLLGALVVALLAWLGGVAAVGDRLDEPPTTVASGLVPPDAHRVPALFGQGDAASQASVEGAWLGSHQMRWSVSPFLFQYMVPPPGVDRTELAEVHWWREAVVPSDVAQASRYRVFSVTEDGVRLHGQDWGRWGLTLEPAPLWLPADVHPGSAWSASGTAAGAGFDDLVDYRMTAKAEAPRPGIGDGCVQVSVTVRLTPRDGAAGKRWTERDVWCPGRGNVDSAGSLDGVAFSVSTAKGERARPLPDNARSVEPDTTDVARWRARPLNAVEGDQTFGTKPSQVPVGVSPVVTTEGCIVLGPGATTDLVGLVPVRSGYWAHWWARPGGQVVSLAAFGRTVVVTTSDRRMSAYHPGGRLLWSVTLDDVAQAAPVRVSDDLLAVASTRGVVSVRNAVDGTKVWSRRVPHGVSDPLASDGTVVAVTDNVQGLHVLDAATGRELFAHENVGLTVERVAVGEGVTVVAGGSVRAYDNRTGRRRWSRTVPDVTDVEIARDVVAVDGGSGVQLLDLTDGTTRRSIPGADDPRRVGRGWFVLQQGSLVAVDEEGSRLAAWRLSAAERREIVVGSAGVWVLGRHQRTGTLVGEWVGPGG